MFFIFLKNCFINRDLRAFSNFYALLGIGVILSELDLFSCQSHFNGCGGRIHLDDGALRIDEEKGWDRVDVEHFWDGAIKILHFSDLIRPDHAIGLNGALPTSALRSMAALTISKPVLAWYF